MPSLTIIANIEIAAVAIILSARSALRLKDAIAVAAPGAGLVALDVAASGLGKPGGGGTLLGRRHGLIPSGAIRARG